ncbi:MAG: tetratricopeptide repeat protein [Chitinophagaceae bacterium]|nr:tetratricopeptide repeat protein [Chitinophagaceae bacterium]
MSPAFPDAWYWIGRCQQQAGQLLEARESYQKAYSLDKSFTEARDAAANMSK